MGTRRGSGFKQRRRRSLTPACQARSPALPVLVPLLPCAMPMSPWPAAALVHPSPPLATLCCLMLSAVLCFFPLVLLAFTAPPPLQPALPHPCSFPPCSHDSQIHRQAVMLQQPAQPREVEHCFGSAAPLMLALTPKAAAAVAAPSPVQGCPAPQGAAGACILRLHPPALLCLRRQLPEDPTHFRLRQGRECPVQLAPLLPPAIPRL